MQMLRRFTKNVKAAKQYLTFDWLKDHSLIIALVAIFTSYHVFYVQNEFSKRDKRIENLENDNEALRNDNKTLRNDNKKLLAENEKLSIKYLTLEDQIAIEHEKHLSITRALHGLLARLDDFEKKLLGRGILYDEAGFRSKADRLKNHCQSLSDSLGTCRIARWALHDSALSYQGRAEIISKVQEEENKRIGREVQNMKGILSELQDCALGPQNAEFEYEVREDLLVISRFLEDIESAIEVFKLEDKTDAQLHINSSETIGDLGFHKTETDLSEQSRVNFVVSYQAGRLVGQSKPEKRAALADSLIESPFKNKKNLAVTGAPQDDARSKTTRSLELHKTASAPGEQYKNDYVVNHQARNFEAEINNENKATLVEIPSFAASKDTANGKVNDRHQISKTNEEEKEPFEARIKKKFADLEARLIQETETIEDENTRYENSQFATLYCSLLQLKQMPRELIAATMSSPAIAVSSK